VAVIDIETVVPGRGTETARTVTIVRLAGDQISHLSHWCTGAL
jgi:hypothetical protein